MNDKPDKIAAELCVIALEIKTQAALQVLIDELIRANLLTPERLSDAFQVRADTHLSHEQGESALFLKGLAQYSKTFHARELGYRE